MQSKRRINGRISLLLLCAAAVLFVCYPAQAQSGRRNGRGAQTPTPTPPAASEPAAAPSPSNPPAPKPATAGTIIVGGDRYGSALTMLSSYVDEAVAACTDRLNHSKKLEVAPGGRMTRKEAVDRAKRETSAYVLWMELRAENDAENTVSIDYYVFTAQTAKILTSGHVYLGAKSIGGGPVGVGVPTVTRRLPLQYQVKEGGRQVAERVLTKLGGVNPAF